MQLSVAILFLVAFKLSASAKDQPRGHLSGKVISYETEEPLSGANIRIIDTDLKTSTDQNGEFVLKNIPAGSYQVEVSLIGYLKARRFEVEVKPGQTTDLLFKLRVSPLILEREVLVVGERPIMDLRLPATKRELSPRELQLVPLTDLKDIVSQQVGVIQDESQLHIRGGRSYENLFLIDELSINDPFTRSGYGFNLSPFAIAEMSLVSGGVNVRYGHVTSGVVDLRIKEGRDKFEGSLTYKTDDFGFDSPFNFNTDFLDFSLSGPANFIKRAISKFGFDPSGDFYFFLNTNMNISDTHLDNPQKLYSSSFGKTRFSRRGDNRYFGIFKLTWKDPSFKCFFTAGKSVVINQDKSLLLTRISAPTYSYGHPYEYSKMLKNYNVFTHESNFQILSFQKILAERLLYSINLSRFFTNLHSDVGGKNWSEYTRPLDDLPLDITLSPDSSLYLVRIGDGFYDHGDGDTWYDHWVETYGLKMDLTSVSSDIHTLKIGFFEEYQTIQLLDIYKPWLGQSGFGLAHDRYKVFANDGAIYLSSDLKLEQAIINFGLRYDFWFPGEYVERAMKDTSLPIITPKMQEEFRRRTTGFYGHRVKGILSPRLGFSAPFSRSSTFFFNYGRLSRKPNPQYLYAKLYSSTESTYQLWGNPNLDSERVTSYEIGIKSLIGQNDALSLVAYYRGLHDYITAARVIPDTSRSENVYLVYFNLDFASSKGVEIEFKRRVEDFFLGSIQLGFSKTVGERSEPEDILEGVGGRSAQDLYQEVIFDWDTPWQVALRATIFSDEKRFRLFGLKLPPHWDLNLNFWAHSGQRYTSYREVISPEDEISFVQDSEINGKIGEYWSGLDLSFQKHFFWKKLKYSLLLEVTNLFDHRNAVIINPLTGDTYKEEDVIPYGEGDPYLPEKGNKVPLWSDPSRYLAPRNIKLGISIKW
ncbi:MAG: TonB-dependent receptor domain-containing protein [Candidatus Zixiibacteriota bacterium]